MKNQTINISLVIPVKNESESLLELIQSIQNQSYQPKEIILVDGGSNDNTVDLAKELARGYPQLLLIETSKASPGRGRNIGAASASNEWIAFTDGGINLNKDWLEKLVCKINENQDIDIVYGNFSPVRDTFFEQCAAISYAPPMQRGSIRGKFIASSLLKKKVWQDVGGFPDMRAAEDLIFMEKAEKKGHNFAFAPEANVHWQLRPDLKSTFKKFILYSKHNVWAGRQWDWHYGVLKQYLVLFPFLLLAVFHSWYWLLVAVLWLFARTVKRMLPHHFELGKKLFNPFIFLGVSFLILVIDLATFIGWGQAILIKDE